MPRETLIRVLLLFFMLALVASGLSAIPLQWELGLLDRWFGARSFVQQLWPSLAAWISTVNAGVQNGYGRYPCPRLRHRLARLRPCRHRAGLHRCLARPGPQCVGA